MRYALKILAFGWRYIKNYRARLAIGLLCGLLYALLNGGAVWAVGALQERFSTNKKAPVFVTQPQDQAVPVGSNAIFTATATGTPPLFYVWSFNESNTLDAVGNTLLLTNVQPTNAGLYSVSALSLTGRRSSSNALLVVTSGSASGSVLPSHKSHHDWFNPAWLREMIAGWKEAADPWFPQVGNPVTWRHWLFLLLFLPLLLAFRGAMDYLSNYLLGWVGEYAVRDIRMDVMEKLSTLSLDFFTRSNTGDLITRINGDTQNLLRTLRTAGPDFIKESISLVIVFGVLCFADWKLTIVAIIIVPLCVAPVVIFGRKARKAMRSARAANVIQTSQLVELIGGIRVIKAFNLEKAEIERFRKSSTQIVRADMKGVRAKEAVGPIIEIVSTLGLGMLVLYILYNPASTHNLLRFFVAFLFFFQSVKKLSGIHILFEQTHISVDRLMDILREQPKVVDPSSPRPLPEFNTAISLQNVGFGYLEKQVLSNVDLEIPRGFKLGIAGESGSGKTTLVNLLFRFYDPTSGAVKIDGLDLRGISVIDLRRQMALVSQDVVIFDQTVAENIAAGRPGATRAEIEAAARGAFAHDFITQLPEGYDTRVGERGVTLSGGQRQRIAIARAFVRNAPILVLDEATASLDSKAEAEVQVAIDHLAQHRTVVCVAHRLSTLKAMDKVVVLSEGRIVEAGSFQELLEKNGVFAAMAARQGIFASEA